jgi:hypothetical protein
MNEWIDWITISVSGIDKDIFLPPPPFQYTIRAQGNNILLVQKKELVS